MDKSNLNTKESLYFIMQFIQNTKSNRLTNLSFMIGTLILCLKNLIRKRKLKVDNLSINNCLIIQNNEIEIIWNVSGCHKIEIDGIGILPGNSKGFKFLFSNRHNPIEIKFFGFRKEVTKKLHIKSTKVDLIDKFSISTKLPIAEEVPYSNKKIECQMSKDNLKMELPNICFDFEPFNIDNYTPINTIQ